jgi:hypothetical protein
METERKKKGPTFDGGKKSESINSPGEKVFLRVALFCEHNYLFTST